MEGGLALTTASNNHAIIIRANDASARRDHHHPQDTAIGGVDRQQHDDAVVVAERGDARPAGEPLGAAGPGPLTNSNNIGDAQQLQQQVPRRLLSRKETLQGLCESRAHVRMREELQREEEVARRHMQRKDKDLGAAHSEVYQLLALFSLIQGGLFAALAQSSSLLSCALWWCPFTISVIVTAGTLAALHQRLKALAALRKELRQWCCNAEALFTWIDDLKTQGAHFDLNTVPELPASEQSRFLYCEPDKPHSPFRRCDRGRRLLWEFASSYDGAVISTVVVISLIVLYARRSILCNPCRCN